MSKSGIGHRLIESFATVPDWRVAKGRRHPLPAILAMATVAMLCRARSLYAIAQWDRLQKPEVVQALGFRHKKTPAVSTLHEVFSQLDAVSFESALAIWAQTEFGDRREAIAVDGKGLRGIHGEEIAGVRLVAAYADKAGLVLAQLGVRTDDHEAELSEAPALKHIRGHWGIENRLHYVRDVNFGEDASQVRKGSAPQVLAALRNAAVGILRQEGWENIAEALRYSAWQPEAALELIGIHPS